MRHTAPHPELSRYWNSLCYGVLWLAVRSRPGQRAGDADHPGEPWTTAEAHNAGAASDRPDGPTGSRCFFGHADADADAAHYSGTDATGHVFHDNPCGTDGTGTRNHKQHIHDPVDVREW